MKPLFFISFLFCLAYCSERHNRDKVDIPSKKHDTTFYSINAYGTIFNDTSKFIELHCGLYLNSNGTLAYKAVDNSYQMVGGKSEDIYLSTIYTADVSDTAPEGQKEMRYVIDTATFKMVSSFYFKDKNYVYDFNPMLDGGSIAINRDIDLSSLQILESEFYAKDKKNYYYRGQIIEGADLKSFRILDTSYSYHIAFDKKNYYDGGNKMSIAEIKRQNLDSIRRKKNGL